MIYSIRVKESVSLAREHWLIDASSLASAVKRAEKRLKKEQEYHGYIITAGEEVGHLITD